MSCYIIYSFSYSKKGLIDIAFSGDPIKLVNVVLTAKIEGNFNIELIHAFSETSEYEPEFFSGLIYRKTDPKITFVLFASGRITNMGQNSIDIAKNEMHKILTLFREEKMIIGSDRLMEQRVVNLVAVYTHNKNIDTETLSYAHNIMYEPEQFPGLFMRIDGLKPIGIIFHSGKIVITGGVSMDESNEMCRRILELI